MPVVSVLLLALVGGGVAVAAPIISAPPPPPVARTPDPLPLAVSADPVADGASSVSGMVSGTWAAGAQVSVSHGGSVACRCTADGGGHWSCRSAMPLSGKLDIAASSHGQTAAAVVTTATDTPVPTPAPADTPTPMVVWPPATPAPTATPTPTPRPTAAPRPTPTPSNPPVKPPPKPGGYTGCKTAPVAYATKKVSDPKLAKGTSKTIRQGVAGLRKTCFTNGRQTSTALIRPPVAKIVHVGTKKPTVWYTATRTLMCTRAATVTAYGYGTSVRTSISGAASASGGAKARASGPAGVYRITARATSASVSVSYGFTGCKG